MTSERAAVEAVLTDFGRLIGIADLEFDGRDRCILSFDDAMVVTIELEEANRRLLIYSSLGEPSGDLPGAYAELLRANYLGGQDGGAMLGLQPDGKAITLSQWVATPGLDATEFRATLERFVNAAEAWGKRLPQLGASEADRAAFPPVQAILG